MSIKSKHSVNKSDKASKKGKRKKMEDSEDMDSSEEELDLTKECHPIGHYVSDRAEMINQMFSVIKGNKLKAMLPPILKDCDLDLLKLQCLDQLLGMSEKRIACILEGEILESSSESDMDSNGYDSDDKNKTSSGSTSEGSGESAEGDYHNDVGKSKRRAKGRENADDAADGKVLPNEEGAPAAEQGKTLLEILELEMRARAIRALLKQNETTHDSVPTDKEIKNSPTKGNAPKDTSEEIVDLTACEDDDFPVVTKKEVVEEMAIDKKVTTFEEKIERSHTEKINQPQEGDRAKRLQAEFELRNKLFKKKCYRTRQQRMENEEEEEDKVPVKQEPAEPEGFLVEDSEEGEVSSSEDEVKVNTERDVGESAAKTHFARPPQQPESTSQSVAESDKLPNEDRSESAGQTSKEKGEADANSDCIPETSVEGGPGSNEPTNNRQGCSVENEEAIGTDPIPDESDASCIGEETSWRDRWLQKDGVQKLVKSSKIYAKVKKRIAEKSQRSKEEVTASDIKSDIGVPKSMEIIEGSIKEYEKLVGKNSQDTSSSEEPSIGATNSSQDAANRDENARKMED